MPKCPKCSADIDHLAYSGLCRMYSNFMPNGMHEDAEYDSAYGLFDCDETWSCPEPECEETLFEDEDEALEFLNSAKKDIRHIETV